MTTHQEIYETRVRILREIAHGKKQVELGRARDLERVQHQCEAIGHIFVADRDVFTKMCRSCAVCGKEEPPRNEFEERARSMARDAKAYGEAIEKAGA